MRTIALLTVVIFISGCSPCKRLARKCPVKDSISYVERIKFDTITLISPADTLYFSIPVEADLNDLIVNVADKPGPSVKISIKDKVLTVEAICPEDSLKAVITGLEKERTNQTTRIEYKDKAVTPRWAWISLIINIVIALLIAFFIYWKAKGAGFLGKL